MSTTAAIVPEEGPQRWGRGRSGHSGQAKPRGLGRGPCPEGSVRAPCGRPGRWPGTGFRSHSILRSHKVPKAGGHRWLQPTHGVQRGRAAGPSDSAARRWADITPGPGHLIQLVPRPLPLPDPWPQSTVAPKGSQPSPRPAAGPRPHGPGVDTGQGAAPAGPSRVGAAGQAMLRTSAFALSPPRVPELPAPEAERGWQEDGPGHLGVGGQASGLAGGRWVRWRRLHDVAVLALRPDPEPPEPVFLSLLCDVPSPLGKMTLSSPSLGHPPPPGARQRRPPTWHHGPEAGRPGRAGSGSRSSASVGRRRDPDALQSVWPRGTGSGAAAGQRGRRSGRSRHPHPVAASILLLRATGSSSPAAFVSVRTAPRTVTPSGSVGRRACASHHRPHPGREGRPCTRTCRSHCQSLSLVTVPAAGAGVASPSPASSRLALCGALPGVTHVVPPPGCHTVPGTLPGGPGHRPQGRCQPVGPLSLLAPRGRRTEQVSFFTRPVCPPGHDRGPTRPAPGATPAVPGVGALVSPNSLSTFACSGPSVPVWQTLPRFWLFMWPFLILSTPPSGVCDSSAVWPLVRRGPRANNWTLHDAPWDGHRYMEASRKSPQSSVFFCLPGWPPRGGGSCTHGSRPKPPAAQHQGRGVWYVLDLGAGLRPHGVRQRQASVLPPPGASGVQP